MRLIPSALLVLILTLNACSSEAPMPVQSGAALDDAGARGEASAPVSPAPPATAAAPDTPGTAEQTPLPPTPLTDAEKGETGARGVLLAWARALENKNFGEAWAQFRRPPSSRDAFAQWWSRYRTITVAVPTGEMDAAAGSLYYTAPATVTGTKADGTPYRLEGDVILRRVNDVDGATPAQLRWGIESADLKSVSPS